LFIQKQSPTAEAGIIANFSNQQFSHTFPFENGVYKKILDSSDTAWNGPTSTLPDMAIKGDKCVLQGFNFAVFLKSTKKGDFVGEG
jgi:hypothetical protein